LAEEDLASLGKFLACCLSCTVAAKQAGDVCDIGGQASCSRQLVRGLPRCWCTLGKSR